MELNLTFSQKYGASGSCALFLLIDLVAHYFISEQLDGLVQDYSN